MRIESTRLNLDSRMLRMLLITLAAIFGTWLLLMWGAATLLQRLVVGVFQLFVGAFWFVGLLFKENW